MSRSLGFFNCARAGVIFNPPTRVPFAVLLIAGFGLLLLLAVALLHRHKEKKSAARLRLVGRVGAVERNLTPEGFVLVEGELWPARLSGGVRELRRGERVRVVGAREHYLKVEPLHRANAEGKR